ncbi:MAG: hypothetical protein LBO20_03655 [Bifidobacteriaceae bacterium]|jgi:hypothetical protein|nr:hypothetical protein [Bifidobacteriaceae bacterium]
MTASLDALVAELERETDRIWLEEPAEIVLIRNGVTVGGGGSAGQYFSVLVHLEAFMMILGPHVMFRLLLLAKDESIDVHALRETTLTLFERPFAHFEFLGDLGLASVHRLGDRYLDELRTIEDREDFVRLTTAFVTFFNRMFRWVHGIFPWNLGAVFAKQTPADVEALAQAIREVTARNEAGA